MNPEPFRVAGEIFGHLSIILKSGSLTMSNSGLAHVFRGDAAIEFEWLVKIRSRTFNFNCVYSLQLLTNLHLTATPEVIAKRIADRWYFELNRLIKELKERNRS